MRAVLAAVGGELCVDWSRVYVHGESNGGMLAYHLMQTMPSTFAAVIPWFGLPLLGYSFGPGFEAVRKPGAAGRTALLHLHGRQDTFIPPGGGVASVTRSSRARTEQQKACYRRWLGGSA